MTYITYEAIDKLYAVFFLYLRDNATLFNKRLPKILVPLIKYFF